MFLNAVVTHLCNSPCSSSQPPIPTQFVTNFISNQPKVMSTVDIEHPNRKKWEKANQATISSVFIHPEILNSFSSNLYTYIIKLKAKEEWQRNSLLTSLVETQTPKKKKKTIRSHTKVPIKIETHLCTYPILLVPCQKIFFKTKNPQRPFVTPKFSEKEKQKLKIHFFFSSAEWFTMVTKLFPHPLIKQPASIHTKINGCRKCHVSRRIFHTANVLHTNLYTRLTTFPFTFHTRWHHKPFVHTPRPQSVTVIAASSSRTIRRRRSSTASATTAAPTASASWSVHATCWRRS